MIRQGIDMGNGTGTIKVFGLFRSHDGEWAAIVPGGPNDTRSGHDHLRKLVRRALTAAERVEIIGTAQDNGHDCELIPRPDGKEWTFTPPVDFALGTDLAEQANVDETHADFLAGTGRA